MATDDINKRLRQEFLTDARDSLSNAQAALDLICGAGGDTGEAALEFRREIHTLKGLGNSFGFPTVSVVAHRLEDYLADAGNIDQSHARPIEVYLDHIEQILEAGVDDGAANVGDLVRALPSGHLAKLEGSHRQCSAEIMLVTPSGVLAKAVKDLLGEKGFRVTTCRTPWAAFEIAVCARPDLVITSVVMDHVSGIDLICALSQIEATASIPKIVLTSFEPDHPQLRRLPAGTTVVESGHQHMAELADAASGLLATRRKHGAGVAGRSLDILLAEDKNANRLLIEMMVRQAGHQLTAVENGIEAVSASQGRIYDLILMDIEMPEMNGVEATRAIRTLPGAMARVPIIALTANDSDDDQKRYLDAGMTDFVAKPINRAALMAAIARQTGAEAVEVDPEDGAYGGGPVKQKIDDDTGADLDDFIESL